MTIDNRLDLRIDPELKAAVRAEAGVRGQSLTVFTERALRAELAPQVQTHQGISGAKEQCLGCGDVHTIRMDAEGAAEHRAWRNAHADHHTPETASVARSHRPQCRCPVCRPTKVG